MSGTSSGGSITIRQFATGGDGGTGNTATGGDGGSAMSDLTFDDDLANTVDAASLTGTSSAQGGAGGLGNNGGLGGVANATIALSAKNSVTATADASGGAGGSVSSGKTGSGNKGGGASASATAISTAGKDASATASATAGRGGAGNDAGFSGGAGADVSAVSASATGKATTVIAEATGGLGGAGANGAKGGKGGASNLLNAVAAVGNGGTMTLRQKSTGGAGGTSNKNDGGDGGAASGALTFNEGPNSTDAVQVLATVDVTGGAGGNGATQGGAAGNASATLNLVGTKTASATARATGGAGGYNTSSGDGGAGGSAVANAASVSTDSGGRAIALAYGGVGGRGQGAGRAGGAGGAVGGSTATATGQTAYARVRQVGGAGGRSYTNATGGAGASSTLVNAVTATSRGGYLRLRQYAYGGEGGRANSAAGGKGGDSKSTLFFSDILTNITQSSDVNANVFAQGGSGGAGVGGGDAGSAEAKSSIFGSRAVYTRVRARGGNGGGGVGSSAGGGAAAGAVAHAVAGTISGTDSATARAVGYGGRGGYARGNGHKAGAGAVASSVSAEAIGRNAFAYADSNGGNGGRGYSGANGGDGAAGSLTDAVKGTTKGGTLRLSQYASGGTGGAGAIAGVGGAAYSVFSFFDDTVNAIATSKLTGTARAVAGSGGAGTVIGGKGGAANAEINLSAERTVDASTVAQGGQGGGGPAGQGGNGGAATAITDALSIGFAADGTAKASAFANAGKGEIDGFADAQANAFTSNGQLATAIAEGDGSSGVAVAKAGTTTAGVVTFTQATATAQVKGVSTAEARANASSAVTSFPGVSLESYGFATSQPNATVITNALNANAEVKGKLGTPLATVFAAGMQGANFGVGDPGTRTHSSSISFIIDSQTLSGDLILGLLDLDSSGIGFKNLTFKVTVEGVTMVDTSFLTLGVATPFFDDTAVSLGDAPNLVDLDVTMSFTWEADATGVGFGFRYILGTMNDEVDITPPAKPSIPDLDAFSDRGASSTDNLTNQTLPGFNGTSEANAKISLRSGTNVIGSGTADKAGKWAITATKALSEGTHFINVTATDAAGNTSVPSDDLEVVIDTTVPISPIPDLDAGSDSGASSSDNVTNDSTPTVGGVTEAGATVSVQLNGGGIGTVVADNDGKWSFTPAGKFADGTVNLSSVVTDRAGNLGKASGPLAVTIDTVAPAAPTTPDMVAASDSGDSDSDNITRQQFPTFVGTAEANAAITLFDGATKVGSTMAAADGSWSIKSDQLAHGIHSLTATATDLAGNVSAASAALIVDVDRAAPAAPTGLDLHASSDSGDSDTDNVTADKTPLIVGKTQINTTVSLFDGATQIGTVKANSNGTWAITAPALAEGKHSLTAKATDIAGNIGAASTTLNIVIDTLAPAAPSTPDLDAASDSGASDTDNLTRDDTPTLVGKAEAGATVTLFDGATPVATTLADAGGLWSFTLGVLTEGAHAFSATARDLAGNVSGKSGVLKVTIDTTPPAAPSVPDMVVGSDLGVSSTDDLTADNTPTFTGKAEAGALVTLFADGKAVGSALADAAGDWSVTASTLADGVRLISATATDAAGNTSAASAALSVTVDTALSTPTMPDLIATFDTGSSNSDNITRNNQPTLTGLADPVVEVTVFDGVTVITKLTTDAAGVWTFKMPALADGAHAITVQARDPAGNLSAVSDPLNLVIDTNVAAPSAPDLDPGSDTGSSNTDNRTNDNTPTLKGTAEANATVTIVEGTKTLGTTVADGAGLWSFTTAVLTDGNHVLKARATDPAGNISAFSPSLTIEIDTKVAPTGRPDMVDASDTGASATDNVTRIVTPIFVGTAEALTTVAVFDNTTLLGTAKSNAAGNWSFKSPALTDGTHAIRTRVIDVAGNVSGFSDALNVTIDTIAPGAPIALDLPATSDSGALTNDNVTNVTTPTIVGKGEAGATITLLDGATVVGTGKVNLAGNWAIKTAALADGAHALAARATDLAGNNSVLSSKLTITVDTTPPSLPTVTSASLTALGGSADAGSTVTILDGATQLGTVIATAGGTWNLLFGLASSTRNLSIQATDTAGNIASPPAPTPFHFGSAGDDVLLGAAGANVFVGGPGDDTFEVDDPGDIVFEALGEGNDTVLASVGYTLGANARVEFLKAAATVTSGLTLTGNGFANTIVGSAFADTLIGAGGADTLTGGGGPDRFTFLGLTDSTLGAAGRDQVTDYSVADGDLLDFSALDANSALAGDQAFIFIGLAAFSGVAGQLRVAAGAGLTVVSGDVNGDSTADFAVTLLGSPVLGPGNFVL